MVNPYTLSPQELLARTLMAEAANQPYEGQLAAASVLANRVKSPNYPNSYTNAILQPGQISAFNGVTGYAGGEGANDLWKGQVSPQVSEIAARVVSGDYEDPTGGALNYYNPKIASPSWGGNAGEGWVDIGDHRFGTAGGGGAGSSSSSAGTLSGQGGSSGLVGSSGDDRLVDVGSEGPQSLGDRVRNFFGRGPGENNPTVTAKRADQRAEYSRKAHERSLDAFDSNAPVSWTNVFGSLAHAVSGRINERRADKASSEASAQIQELLSSGSLDPETIAAVMALDPEMGKTLHSQAFSRSERLAGQEYSDSVREDTQAHDLEKIGMQQDFNAAQNTLDRLQQQDLILLKGEISSQELTTLGKQLREAGYEPGTAEYEEAMREQLRKDGKDARTTLMKEAEAAGYVPGTVAYEDFIKSKYDSTNSPEYLAAVKNSEAAQKGANEFSKVVGKEAANASTGLATSARTAAAQVGQWEIARNAMKDFRGGTLAPTLKSMGSFLSSIGISDQDLADLGILDMMQNLGISEGQSASMEQFEQIVNEAIIGKIGSGGTEGGFPANNFSNADLEFLKTSVPGLTNTSTGMRAKLALLEWRDRRTIEKSNAWMRRLTEINEVERREPTSYDWQQFENEWMNNAEVNDQMKKELEEAHFLDSISTGGVLEPKTQEEFDRIPSGSYFRNSDGRLLMKP